MAVTYCSETVTKLQQQTQQLNLHRPMRVGRFEPGATLSYDVTAVGRKSQAKVTLLVKRFVGGGFAGQVYQVEILKVKVPDAPEKLTRQVVEFVQHLRTRDLFKLPGVAETLDWAHALAQLDVIALDPKTINSTLGTLLKYQDDIEKINGETTKLSVVMA